MSSENTNTFTKENLNTYLGELAKQYRKLYRKAVESDILLLGGAAVLANYSFREIYRTFSNVLRVRTMNAEYLVAMKLMSGRQYKHDLFDVIGILVKHQKKNNPLNLTNIERAVTNLYGQWENLPATSQSFIRSAIEHPNLSDVYEQINCSEQDAKAILISFEERYPCKLTAENAVDIISHARAKSTSRDSLLEMLKAKTERN